jgi:hypothetical protein
MPKHLITLGLVLAALAASTPAAAGDLDFELLGAEAYRIPTPSSLDLGAESTPSRRTSLAVEAGVGALTGLATAALFYYPLSQGRDGGNPDKAFYASGAGNAVGGAVGIWLGGKLMGRQGSPLITLGAAMAGHFVGSMASFALVDTENRSLGRAPLALGLTLALPTVLGLVGYNLTD